MITHPQIDIPAHVLNVVDPTGCTMFNNKPVANEDLALTILDKYGHKLSKKMLNAIVSPSRTSCLTRAIIAGYNSFAIRLLQLRDPVPDGGPTPVVPDGRTPAGSAPAGTTGTRPLLTLATLTEDCHQGYAVYHRGLGRRYRYLQEFREREGRWPKPVDMAMVMGMTDVLTVLEGVLAEWREQDEAQLREE